MLSGKFRNEISWNGFPSDIMRSGLQKYIRRGMTEKALFCAGELDLFKEAEDRAETIRTNFLHRIMIIYMEDVENISLFNEMYEKINNLLEERKKQDRSKEKEARWISEIVVQLASSTKARICSHVRAVYNPMYQPLHAHYPSIASLWKEIEPNNTLAFNCEMFAKNLKEKNIASVYYGFQIHASSEKLPE